MFQVNSICSLVTLCTLSAVLLPIQDTISNRYYYHFIIFLSCYFTIKNWFQIFVRLATIQIFGPRSLVTNFGTQFHHLLFKFKTLLCSFKYWIYSTLKLFLTFNSPCLYKLFRGKCDLLHLQLLCFCVRSLHAKCSLVTVRSLLLSIIL